MFEPVVTGSRVHVVAGSELLDVAEPLELKRVDELHRERVQLDVTVHRVVEVLEKEGIEAEILEGKTGKG